MSNQTSRCFAPARILLPAPGTPLDPWACIAVDQFTSQPEYWQKAEALAKDKPSTLHIVLPEAYLGTDGEEARLESIRRTMSDYRRSLLTRVVNGFVYLERTQMDGTVRQGLVGAVDLEAYSFEKNATPAIRPSENTVVERIPPRLRVRRGAELETPHVMLLADDEDCTLIEPIGRETSRLPLLYDGELMLGGGHLTGWAVEDPALIAQIEQAVAGLGDPARYAARWPEAAGQPPMTLAVGDGNHSLATAKAYWEERKQTLTPAQRETDPARYCLVEVCNVHSPAIEIEPIHRVLFGIGEEAVLAKLQSWADSRSIRLGDGGEQCFTLVSPEGERTVGMSGALEPLTVGTAEAFVGALLADCPDASVDYVHGEDAVRQLAQKGAVGMLMPGLKKADLFRGVVLGGVLPRKTFSMGHAEEKRYYNECRSLVD
ncbi:DUF1015 domain-containing protein [uncultured Gemmiger sp.]|uniref:DUF1015 domain-containing protein n=1 Tax=uncultured Gemmiger sp. TaxID=1623490 RepID=UPI0025CF70E4|nr:DUF1015 domain-containing protein [uncultured Gemmiger sp.]